MTMLRRLLGDPPHLGGVLLPHLGGGLRRNLLPRCCFLFDGPFFLVAVSYLFLVSASAAEHFLSTASGGGEEVVRGKGRRIEERGGHRQSRRGGSPMRQLRGSDLRRRLTLRRSEPPRRVPPRRGTRRLAGPPRTQRQPSTGRY